MSSSGLLKDAAWGSVAGPLSKRLGALLRPKMKELKNLWAFHRPSKEMPKRLWRTHRPTWAGTKRLMVGEPGRLMKEIRQGKAWGPKGLIRTGIRESTQSPLGKAMFYGLPAYEGYNIMKGPPEGRAERIGGLLASTPVWLGAWKPLGMVGSTLLAGAAEAAGRQVGKKFDKPNAAQTMSPSQHLLQNYAPQIPQEAAQYMQYHPRF